MRDNMKNSFALLILVALTSLFGFTDPALAQDAATDSGQLLSYSQLMELTPDVRANYIDGVRVILIDLAKRSDGKFSDRDPAARSRLKAWLEIIDRELKTARADSGESPPVPRDQRRDRRSPIRLISPSVVETSPEVKSSGLSLITGSRPKETSSSTIEDYILKSSIDAVKFRCLSKDRQVSSAKAVGITRPCSPSEETEISASFKSHSFLAPKKSDEPAVTTRGILAPTEATRPAPAAIEEVVPAPVKLKTASDAASPGLKPLLGRKVPYSELSEYIDRKESPDAICADEAKKIGATKMHLVATDETNDRYCMTKEGEALFREGKLSLPSALSAEPSSPDETSHKKAAHKAAATKDPSKAKHGKEKEYACAPKAEVCEVPKSKADLIFPPNISCVFAGMLANFDSKNRKCQPQTEFSLGDKKYTCASGQTMCNPLLFGTVSSTTPICIGRGSNATEQCSKLSSSRDAVNFLNRSENGLQEKWDEFRKGLADTCKAGSVSAKFHCVECNIMRARIFDLQARLLSNPCKPNRYDDGDNAIDLRIKLGGPKSSGTKR
ncbi:hypothetical protein BH10BDE1_BH10BDE1_14930 [soil metagenome]